MSIKHTIQCKLGKHELAWKFLPDSCEQRQVCVHCQQGFETRQQPHIWGEWQTLEGTLTQQRTCDRCNTHEQRPVPVRVRKDNTGLGTIIEIPAGPFWMGSDRWESWAGATQAPNLKLESPRHSVSLPTYWIGRTQVTVFQFRSFVRASGYQWKNADKKQGEGNHPIVYVNWFDVLAYCQWLTDTWHASGMISPNEVVLPPSEAEWEKAARGIDGRIYPWGESGVFQGHYEALGPTKPVGSYSPAGDSPYGCADMAGNVHEWTRSLLREYPYKPSAARENLKSEEPRIVRGGSFRTGYYYVQTTTRCVPRSPDTVDDDLGFRVVVISN